MATPGRSAGVGSSVDEVVLIGRGGLQVGWENELVYARCVEVRLLGTCHTCSSGRAVRQVKGYQRIEFDLDIGACSAK